MSSAERVSVGKFAMAVRYSDRTAMRRHALEIAQHKADRALDEVEDFLGKAGFESQEIEREIVRLFTVEYSHE